MREIKFRGKRVDNGELVEGSLVKSGDCDWFIFPRGSALQKTRCGSNEYVATFYKVIPETVGQSTGLKGKNGKELNWWEGDLFMMHGHSIPWVIVKEQGCFWFKCPVTKERKLCYRVAEYFNQPVKVGNIHDNPKLLETKNVT